MPDSRSLFRHHTTRKPRTWDEADIVSYTTLTDSQREALAGLPIIEAPGDPRDDIEPAPPQESIVVHDGARYYANTEGYDYPRYLVRIINWPAQ